MEELKNEEVYGLEEMPSEQLASEAEAVDTNSDHSVINKNIEWSDSEMMDYKSFGDAFNDTNDTNEKEEKATTPSAGLQTPSKIGREENINEEATDDNAFDKNIFNKHANGQGQMNITEMHQITLPADGTEVVDSNNSITFGFNIDKQQGLIIPTSQQETSLTSLKNEGIHDNIDDESFDTNIFDDITDHPVASHDDTQAQAVAALPTMQRHAHTQFAASSQTVQQTAASWAGQTSEGDGQRKNFLKPLKAPSLLNRIPQSINTSTAHGSLQKSLADIENMYYRERSKVTSASTSNTMDSMHQMNGGLIQKIAQNSNCEVIELSDEDESTPAANSMKRQRLEPSKATSQQLNNPAIASYTARNQNMPGWMNNKNLEQGTHHQQQQQDYHISNQLQKPMKVASASTVTGNRKRNRQHPPIYFALSSDFVPTWKEIYPIRMSSTQYKAFELSLLNVQEFTISGLSIKYDGPPSSVSGLRKKIKEISKGHGKAVFERDDKEGTGGKWRIPLGAYRSFFSYLNSDPMIRVTGIPENQLKIASLGKARLERGFPSKRNIISKGVPRGLAKALAPFQRGGVDFIAEKEGRALIADDMGLGKTIQAIAGLTIFHEEWPILVLTPSSARYHWESEFQQWLGIGSSINKDVEGDLDSDVEGEKGENDDLNDASFKDFASVEKRSMDLLEDSQIHVLTSSKEELIPNESTQVVICSYGLAPLLITSGKLRPGLFRCAIVDESHMLKNINTKRTRALVPVLHATNRCVLLSGTPALARPSELFPQLKILSTESTAWWDNEEEFQNKYVRRSSPARRAELYTMLTGTVMIRRLKNNILKSMPQKIREKSVTNLSTPEQRKEFQECMALLREGKGVMGKLARQHSALDKIDDTAISLSSGINQQEHQNIIANDKQKNEQVGSELINEYQQRVNEKMHTLQHSIATTAHQFHPRELEDLINQQKYEMQREALVWYKERLQELEEEKIPLQNPELTRKSALNRMYTLTAKAKIPLIADMIIRWLSDPTKGKLCVFAHHIFVLDDLIKLVGLSNADGSDKRYIRIDGSTSPKNRQAQIKAFQTDIDVKVAILGITAAGVAVTLTASSTVWFAELFWTPALMIQAEDRCHRIGQNSQVKCLYFVAVGTLDELLWKLLEKKFRDLGEFVEGREKMKIVVNKTYKGEKDLHTMFRADEDDPIAEMLDVENVSGDATNAENFFGLEEDLESDIVMLAKEELTMIMPEGDDDEVEATSKFEAGTQQQPNNVASLPQSNNVAGASEEDAITLLSDDEDEKPAATSSGIASKAAPITISSTNTPTNIQPQAQPKQSINSNNFAQAFQSLPNCKFFKILFEGPSYGIQLIMSFGRVIVGRKVDAAYKKPAVGDILVAVNGRPVPMLNSDIAPISNLLKRYMTTSSVELTFAEDEGFAKNFVEGVNAEHRKQMEVKKQRRMELEQQIRRNQGETGQQKSSQRSGEVIELLDDD